MRRQLRTAASSGKLPDSREACYFLPRGGGQADRVRAVDPAANNVGLPLDVLRRPDAAPRPLRRIAGLLLAVLLRRGADQPVVSVV
jgi:hypothetical protein